ncbi:hypothetical protein [Paenibacillus nuruki]|uniref:hypothetical protein n=1 Tax=Paenibacillus nuruki TaxID=1886670 RepID=UPI002805E152|nr:hypothetical protein [Paenibacillus nuruki]CAJ1315958.1 hypothetical protein AASFL403_12100 [Paenibacillus nuruki]
MGMRWEQRTLGKAISGTEEEMKAFFSHITYKRSYINPTHVIIKYKNSYLCEIEKVFSGWMICNEGITFQTKESAVLGAIENYRLFKSGTLNGDRSAEWIKGQPELAEQEAKHNARIAFLERKGFLPDDLRAPSSTHDDESSYDRNENNAISSL